MMSAFLLSQLVVLIEFIIDERTDHSPVDFFDNYCGKSCFSRLFTYFIDDLLDAVWSMHGGTVTFESCCSFNTLATLRDHFNQFTVNLIDTVSNILN
ncbi:Uncharacterised protein [Metakosakonia massiliensis]|uniref:Uncharacterized protein n=1 Tax=Phytobacter massiliensis TaxID=1485952 RepID=A0A6N3E2F9_9ENTR